MQKPFESKHHDLTLAQSSNGSGVISIKFDLRHFSKIWSCGKLHFFNNTSTRIESVIQGSRF